MVTPPRTPATTTSDPAPPRPRIGRVPIRDLSPQQPENRWPAKAYVGEVVPFEATVFREGHGELLVDLLLTHPDGSETVQAMHLIAPGTDRWRADVLVPTPGDYRYRVRGRADQWATWLHVATIKIGVGDDVELTLSEGAALLEGTRLKTLATARDAFLDTTRPAADRLAVASEPRVVAAIATHPVFDLESISDGVELRVERARAAVGAWYEFFPRSEGAKRRRDGSWTSGTLRSAARRLPAIAEMGFDVVYLPPIHPIGHAFRKGPNNSPVAGPHDPGSPWAIGDATGGHDAIHPDLGRSADLRAFIRAAAGLGIEVALDLALQCSPDHPWVREHPEWFLHRADGSIAYAENPPKKYQDIYPLYFDTDPDGIRTEVLRIIEHWIAHGVRIFRVDNPHTKPLGFWELLLADVARRHPDVVFLAEAFTRPAMLHALAGAGFHQSYTYYTWRNTKLELEEFLSGLALESADYLRPNLFVNTPDILTEYLQFGGPAAYRIRAAIAATAAPSWGVYSGYELYEDVARPGSEENIDNEKYEYRPRPWAKAAETGRTLAPYLTKLNRIRAEHPALGQLRNLRVHWSDDESVLVYSKVLDAPFTGTGQPDRLIVVANVDPHSVRETLVHLDLLELGLEPGARFRVRELITGAEWTWTESNYVRLDAFTEPVHILSVEEVLP